MSNYYLIPIHGEPPAEDKKIMIEGMLAHHAKSGHPRSVDTYSLLLKNSTGVLAGMVIVSFLYHGMEIQTLWVEVALRGQGWGRRLMEAVETEGVRRGCTIAYTNTFSWQAPGFYEKMGYTLYGKLENFPIGNSLSYYSKVLS